MRNAILGGSVTAPGSWTKSASPFFCTVGEL